MTSRRSDERPRGAHHGIDQPWRKHWRWSSSTTAHRSQWHHDDEPDAGTWCTCSYCMDEVLA